jgi:hypothetical protein
MQPQLIEHLPEQIAMQNKYTRELQNTPGHDHDNDNHRVFIT